MAPLGQVKLPSAYTTIRDALDVVPQIGSLINVIGVVCDFRGAIPTRTQDWKCQIQLYDISVQDDLDATLQVNIFGAPNEMPESACGDVVVIRQAKLQSYRSDIPSLLTNRQSSIFIYSANQIARPPGNAVKALIPSKKKTTSSIGATEHAYVSFLYHNIDKERLPTALEFEQVVKHSLNHRQKFQLLKDVEDHKFYDLVVEVVREPYDMGDKFTLWVTDYTENSSFFNHAFSNDSASPLPNPNDPHGYGTKSATSTETSWSGPFGKRSLQISCWEHHAALLRELKLEVGQWVLLQNVQVAFGANGQNLEGFLRGERGQYAAAQGSRMRITKLSARQEPENIDPRLKSAIRRKYEYQKAKKRQLQEIEEAGKAGSKRRAALQDDALPKENTKKRRNAGRAKIQAEYAKKMEQANAEVPTEAEVTIPVKNLNARIKCENSARKSSSVEEILQRHWRIIDVNGKSVRVDLPFLPLDYRANLRVVDFDPPNLKDFTRVIKKKDSEFEVLSDKSFDSSSDSDDTDDEIIDVHNADWEWSFSLQLEDATADKAKKRFWALVDNASAQCLLNLDASNLHRDGDGLTALKMKLSTLWGNLEEHKTRQLVRTARQRGQPPADSDEETEPAPEEIANWPFPCCIRQYGVKIPERDPDRANAGGGRAWKRVFSLFGTRIVDAP